MKTLLIVSQRGCMACEFMKQVEEELIDFMKKANWEFDLIEYKTNTDDWAIADKLGIDATPSYVCIKDDRDDSLSMDDLHNMTPDNVNAILVGGQPFNVLLEYVKTNLFNIT